MTPDPRTAARPEAPPADRTRAARWNPRGLSPQALRALCAKIAVALKLDVNGDLRHLTCLLNVNELMTMREAREVWAGFLRDPLPPDHQLSLYLHVPFCETFCTFCQFGHALAGQEDALERYALQMEKEIEFFAPAFAGRAFHSWLVGGGSPSILSAAQLRRVLGAVRRLYRFEPDAYLSIECNPKTADDDKLVAMREAGFHRVSMGVQTFEEAVLRAIKRDYQTESMVAAAVGSARRAGFSDINLDLVMGLLGETDDGFLESFRAVASMGPMSIAVHRLFVTNAYAGLSRLQRSDYGQSLEGVRSRLWERMLRLADECGYLVSIPDPHIDEWQFYRKDCPATILSRPHQSDAFNLTGFPASIFALGPYGVSRVFGRLFCERSGLTPQELSFDRPLYSVRKVNLKEEMLFRLVYGLAANSLVDRAEFRASFGVDVFERFGEEIDALAKLGQARAFDDRVEFLPRTAASRYVHAMIFFRDVLGTLPTCHRDFRKVRPHGGDPAKDRPALLRAGPPEPSPPAA